MFDVEFNRRALLGAGAIGAVAALIGCSGGSAETPRAPSSCVAS